MEIFASIFLGFICNGFSLLMLMCSTSFMECLTVQSSAIKGYLLLLLYVLFIIGSFLIFAAVFNVYLWYYILGILLLFVLFVILNKLSS